jgi:hypothetical protein
MGLVQLWLFLKIKSELFVIRLFFPTPQPRVGERDRCSGGRAGQAGSRRRLSFTGLVLAPGTSSAPVGSIGGAPAGGTTHTVRMHPDHQPAVGWGISSRQHGIVGREHGARTDKALCANI